MKIPRIIHQSWKDADVPADFAAWQRSWKMRNPAYEYRLWTDADLETLVRERYPALLGIFLGYRDPICRVDLGRYLVLKSFGGIYADLDCECLRPIEALLVGSDFLIAPEPASHAAGKKAKERGLDELLCPTFIASVLDHPFWDHILTAIEGAADERDALDATGPFLLTRAYRSFARPRSLTLAPSHLLYPFDKEETESGSYLDIVRWERATRDSFAVHYWAGTWWRRTGGGWKDLPRTVPVRIIGGKGDRAKSAAKPAGKLVSCLMIVRGNEALAYRALRCFGRQRHAERELLVVTSGEDPDFGAAVKAEQGARLIEAPPGAVSVDLALMAIKEARGDFLCFWEAEALHDPQRLAFQLAALEKAGADASLILAPMLWHPSEGRLFVAERRSWDGTLLVARSALARAGRPIALDAPIAAQLLERGAVVSAVDLPRLYVRTADRLDAEEAEAAEAAWNNSAIRFSGERYRAVLAELGKRLPIDGHPLVTEGRAAPASIELLGHLTAAIGLGAAARGTASALAAAGLPHTVHDLELRETHPYEIPPRSDAASAIGRARDRVKLVHTNPDALARVMAERTRGEALRFDDCFTIGFCVWEAQGILDSWRSKLPLFDEFWVPSRYTAELLAPELAVPAIVMPHPVEPQEPTLDRTALGLPEDRFIFLFTFDATSTVERKNPAAIIRAYRAAFAQDDGTTLLVLKAKKLDAAELRALTALAEGRSDIRIINETYGSDRIVSLIAACDCYVSLHRAEGFGLSIAEAMCFAKPVIATAYSGNMEFMAEGTAFPVPYSLYELPERTNCYRAGTIWAQPDEEAACALMRQVASDPDAARAVGRRAALHMRSRFSAEAVGERMRERLSFLSRSGNLQMKRRPFAQPSKALARGADGADVRVLLLTPVKNAEPYLARYFELLGRLEFPKERLSVAFLDSDSVDRTHALLDEWAKGAGRAYRRVELFRHDFGYAPEGPRWAPALQRQRREILARSRNRLLIDALDDEDWVLWLDVDLVDYPPNLLDRLLATGRDLVVPICQLPDGTYFDLNSFGIDARQGGVEDPRHLRDGLFQPPRGAGRIYPAPSSEKALVPLDGVGGTALLVRADLHRDGLVFPPLGYRGYIETEGLAMMAADMGVPAFAVTDLVVTHFDGRRRRSRR